MDVIINNPPAQAIPQTYAQMQGTPYGYGPQPYGYHDHPPGPGFLLPLLLIGGFIFFKRRSARCGRRFMGAAGGSQDLGRSDFQDIRQQFRQGRDRFFNDGAFGIARERYAKGEINAEEYEALRRNLSGESQPDRTSYVKTEKGDDLKL